MSGWKKALMALLILLLLVSTAAGVRWNLTNYVMVDFHFYPRNQETLDLREESISIARYEKLQAKLPECRILWNVPFRDTVIPQDTVSITITALAEEDLQALEHLTELKTVSAWDCRDYGPLLALEQRRPELELLYDVELGGEAYDRRAEEIHIADIAREETALLPCFNRLKAVTCSGGEAEAVALLESYCRDNAVTFHILAGEERIEADAAEVTVSAADQQDLRLLQSLKNLQTLHLIQPEAPAEAVIALREQLPEVEVTWEMEVCGISCTSGEEELDLSKSKNIQLEQLKEAAAYFPDAEIVFLGNCGIDNEELASFREEMRSRFKLVWTVQLGEKLTARTDDTTFMPVREYVYYFNDEEAYNLRYCEDMVCIDIGHMSIHNIEFVKYMPNLTYLILAHSQLQYIEPIRHCKNLKFLELDWSPLRDLSPLVGCTALEDLNLGNTYADLSPLKEMTWLKNLWLIGCSSGAVYEIREALPDTMVQSAGNATVASGWRNLPNYYDMRDVLGMHYMSW